MKLVESKVEKWEQEAGYDGVFRAIERAARICYASTPNSNISSEQFVEGLIKKDHARCLEFGTIYLKVPLAIYYPYENIISRIVKNHWSRGHYKDYCCYITTNYRVIVECKLQDFIKDYICEPTEYHEKRYTFHLICSRAIGDEYRTHISLSSMMQSTRYCNYNKDKFGNEVSYVIPVWYNNAEPKVKLAYEQSLQNNELSYFELIKNGLQPQDARGVLGLDVRTELVLCGFKDAWDNFFYRRCDKAAHPDAQKLANEIKAIFT